MNDKELRDALRDGAPAPGAGYWDRIDASLEAAATGEFAGSKEISDEMEIESTVIRLTDMNQQRSTSTNPPRTLLAVAAATVAVVGIGAVALTVTGNDSDPTNVIVSDTGNTEVDDVLPVPTADPADSTVATTEATETPTTVTALPLPLSIPDQLRGTWRESDNATVTADECRQEFGFESNFGRVLTVTDSGFMFFESGGSLVEVHEVATSRIDATYDTTLADTETQERLTFDASQDTSVLLIEGAERSESTRYVRCPAIPDAAPLALSFPDSMQGTWRESDGAAVTADECRQEFGFDQNFGRVLTINTDTFMYFESGGQMISIDQRDDARIEARFDTTLADEPTEEDFIFEVQSDGTVLTVNNVDLASSVRYLRCPA